MSVHDLLKCLIDAGYTQKRIAELTGINQPTISRILNGKQADVSFTNGKRLEEVVRQSKQVA